MESRSWLSFICRRAGACTATEKECCLTSKGIWKVNRLNHMLKRIEAGFFFVIMFFNTEYWMCFFLFLCSFSEHRRYKENTVWVELQTCERVQKDKHPACLAPQKEKKKRRENISYLLQQKGPQPWINVCTGSTRKQRILGYLKAWSTQVNRPGLSLQQRGLAWLRPAICQLIMPVGPDRREEPLLKRTSFYARITIRLPKNLICSYGCWARQF